LLSCSSSLCLLTGKSVDSTVFSAAAMFVCNE
jgi:hypothetical protein